MSATVDNRVLEMQFDNKQFEREVATSMSTLDKLKQKLNTTESVKGLEDLNSAAKKFDLSGMGTAIDTVHAKFSALQIMGTTALMNITNSAVNAGKRMLNAITIEPVRTGFEEYETQINAVQTILANTQHNGTTIKEVNEALDELNHYADLTIYNFTEMTRNIGTFTAAGIDLETSVSAIQGIANLAAVSGSTSQQASTAMYQLSQALAAGTVKLMDWNSVVNAGMGGKVFQDALIKTSEELQTGAKEAIEAEGSFRESLQKGWLTADVLTQTLKKFTTSGAVEYLSDYTGVAKEELDTIIADAKAHNDDAKAIDAAADAIAKKSGKNKQEIKEALQMAQNAEDAATKVKTLTQLWDVLKEAVQSGWSQTWRLLVGDFEEAKALFTPISDYLTGVIGMISDARNNLLEAALGTPFAKMLTDVMSFTGAVGDAVTGTEEMAASAKDLEDIVNRVILGDFGNGEERFNALTDAEYNWMEVQNKVNETLGDSFRYSQEEIDAQNELLGVTKKSTDANEDAAAVQKKVADAQERTLDQLAEMSDTRLKEIGMTDDQIKSLRSLEQAANAAGMSIGDFVEKYAGLDGRTILIETLKNAASGIVGVFKAMSTAWKEVFPPTTTEQLFGLIARLHEFSESLRLTLSDTGELNENGQKLLSTFRGLFSIIDILSKITGGALKIGFEVVSQILSAFNLDILGVTASIGDAIYGFDQWLKENDLIRQAISAVVPGMIKMGKAIVQWVESLLKIPAVSDAISTVVDRIESLIRRFSDFITSLRNLDRLSLDNFLNTLKEAFNLDDIPFDFIEGFANGIRNGISEAISAVLNLGSQILAAFRGVLGIHSPSTETEEDGKNFVLGFINGAVAFIGKALEVILNFGKELLNGLTNNLKYIGNFINAISDLFTNTLWAILQLATGFIKVITAGVKSLNNFMGEEGDNFVTAFTKGASGVFGEIFKFAQSIADSLKGGLENAKWGDILSGGLLVGIVTIAKKIADVAEVFASPLEGVGDVMSAFSKVLEKSAKSISKVIKTFTKIEKGVAKVLKGFAGIEKGFKKVLKGYAFKERARGVLELAAAMLVVVGALAILANIAEDKPGALAGAIVSLIFIAGILGALAVALNKLTSSDELIKIDKSGVSIKKTTTSVLSIALALLAMVAALKLVANMDGTEIAKGFGVLAGCLVVISAVMAAFWGLSKKFNGSTKDFGAMGSSLLKMSVAMLLMIGVIKLSSTISASDVLPAVAFAAGFVIFVGALAKVSSGVGNANISKLSKGLLGISVAMGLMVGVVALIGLLSWGTLAKGALFVAGFTVFLSALIGVTSLLSEGSSVAKISSVLLSLSASIGILAAICALLGFIDVGNLIKGTLAVGALSAFLAGLIIVTKLVKDVDASGLVMASVAVGILAASVYALASTDAGMLLGATAAMAALMLVFTLLMKVAQTAQQAVAPMATMAVVIGILGGVLYLLAQLPIEQTIGTAAALAGMLVVMVGAFVVLGTFGGLAGTAMSGALGMMGVIAIIGVIAGLIGALVSLIPPEWIEKIKTGFRNFLDLIVMLAEGLGEAVGAFAGGLLSAFSSGIEALGESLAQFSESLSTFIETASGINSDAITSISNLTSMITSLTASSLLDGIAEFITGTSSMEAFGEKLNQFAEAIVPFSNRLAEANLDEGAISAATNAGLLMTELQSAIPKSGGWIQNILGESDWEKFNVGISGFGNAIAAFNAALGGKNFDASAIETATTAGQALTELQNAIPEEHWFDGKVNLEEFADYVKKFGEAMGSFGSSVSGNDSAKVSGSVTAAKRISEFITSLSEMDTTGAKGFIGGGLSDGTLVNLGQAIGAYGNAVSDVNVGVMNQSINAAIKIRDFIKSLSGFDSGGLKSFKSAMSSLSDLDIGSIAKSFDGSASDFSSVGLNMASSISKGIGDQQGTVVSTMSSLIQATLKVVTGKIGDFTRAGTSIGSKFIESLRAQVVRAASIMSGALSSAVGSINNYRGSFYTSGLYLGEGLVSGINAKKSAAYAAGFALGREAVKGERAGQESKSPSKATEQSGIWLGEGLINGMNRIASAVYATGKTIGAGAANSMSTTVASISDYISSGMDVEPTIRPVIDLSDVRSGVNRIHGMMNFDSKIGVSANINAINSMMSSQNQNQPNADVVSAIRKLEQSLATLPRNSYQIGSVAYDDGSNISIAMQSLVRAIRIDGRS